MVTGANCHTFIGQFLKVWAMKSFFFFKSPFPPLLPKKGSVIRHFKLSQWKPAIKQPIIDFSVSNYETHNLINVTAKMSNVTKLASFFFITLTTVLLLL